MTGQVSGLALLGAAVLLWVLGVPAVAGVPAFEAASLLLYGAGALWLTGWAVERARPSVRDTAGALAMWAIFVATLTAVYVRRDAAAEGLRAAAEEAGFAAPVTVVTEAGEVAILRRRDGTFQIPAVVNGVASTFVFDTGASAVVLTTETARDLGFATAGLTFRVPVATANGRMMAAPVMLERLAIGPIALGRIPALVAGPGLLHGNLLGQTVLDRLESYEVRGNRLVLRARKG